MGVVDIALYSVGVEFGPRNFTVIGGLRKDLKAMAGAAKKCGKTALGAGPGDNLNGTYNSEYGCWGMSGPVRQSEVAADGGDEALNVGAELFAGPKAEPASRGLLFGAAAAAVLIAAVGAVFLMHRPSAASAPLNAVLPVDPYAANISFTQLAMSESTSLSGGKSTFLDGHVRNSGGATLTGVTMQVLFKNDEGLAPMVETLPLTLVRTHEPYLDTESVGAAPLKPGDEAEFRLIFETVPPNWNQQMPELRVVRLAKR